jgi:flagellar hook protein FlgE
MDAINIAARGMMEAGARFDASARRVAGGEGDLATEAVEQVLSKTAFEASIAVVRTGDAMIKRLLDITA